MEFELAFGVGPDHLAFAQFLDEAAEQRLVEKFRRVEFVQQRQALRGQGAEVFELDRGERVRPVAHERGDRDVIALDRLQQRLRDDAQLERAVALARFALHGFPLLVHLEQTAGDEEVDGLLHARIEFVLAPRQEQFGLHERIDEAAQAQDLLALHAAVVEEAAGDPRRGRDDVQHVVAEIRKQHRGFALAREHVAERVLDARDRLHLLAVGDDVRRAQLGDRELIGIRQRGDQLAGQVDLREQVGFGHRVLWRRQQHEREQVDRIDVDRAVDVDDDALGQRVDGGFEPGRFRVRIDGRFAPVRIDAVEQGREEDRLAEIHRDLAVIFAQLAERAQQLEPGFLFLRLARQLADVGIAFHDALVADIDRLEHDRPLRFAQEAAQRHRQQSAARRERAPGARAAAFDEVFDRYPAREQLAHVFAEHGRIQRIVEAAAHEERAAAAQERAEDRQIEVHPRGDMRHGHAVAVEQIRQQHVIDVAAVAGHEDHFVARRDRAHLLEVMHAHAGIDFVPQPGQQRGGRTHERMRLVGGDLPGHRARLVGGGVFVDVFLARRGGDRGLHGRGVDHRVDQRAPVRQVRADDDCALALEVHAQHARHLAQSVRRVALARQHLAQRHGRGEMHDRVAAVEQQREQAAEAADHAPVFREQHTEPARFAVGGAADEDRYRHELHVEIGMHAHRLEQLRERLRMRFRARLLEPPAVAPRQGEHRALLGQAGEIERAQRLGQAGFTAGLFENQGIGQTVALDHVADRHVRGEAGARIGRIALDLHPRLDERPERTQPPRRLRLGRGLRKRSR